MASGYRNAAAGGVQVILSIRTQARRNLAGERLQQQCHAMNSVVGRRDRRKKVMSSRLLRNPPHVSV